MSRPPSPPSLVRSRLDEIRTVTRALEVNYRELFQAAHDRVVRETVKVQGSMADPTADIATSGLQAALRRTCAEADRRVERAYADLETALRLTAQALDKLDPPDTPVVMDKRRVTKEQLAEAREAQARRQERENA